MSGSFHNDPTQFFSVVGAPYIHENHSDRIRYRPRLLDIGAAALGLFFCTIVLGVSLFAETGAAKLAQVASYVVR